MDGGGVRFRDRIKELRRVAASDLVPHPANWRRHPPEQRRALAGLLAEVGFAGAVLTRVLDDGRLQILDGHLRTEELQGALVPVLVTDLSEAEAAVLLASFDPISAMAVPDPAQLGALLATVKVEDARVQDLLRDLGAPLEQAILATRQAERHAASREGAKAPHVDVPVVEVMVAVDDLAVIERAFLATGRLKRGDALAELARAYLDDALGEGH